jgi:hypothetical protein
MTRRLFTLDEIRDNFHCAIALAVAGGLWSEDVAQVVAALGAGFGLKLDLPRAATTTTVDVLPASGILDAGSVNAEAARLLAAMMRLAQKEEAKR